MRAGTIEERGFGGFNGFPCSTSSRTDKFIQIIHSLIGRFRVPPRPFRVEVPADLAAGKPISFEETLTFGSAIGNMKPPHQREKLRSVSPAAIIEHT